MWMPYWDKHICMCGIPQTCLIIVCCMIRHMRDMRDMLYSYMPHDSSVGVASLIHDCDMSHMWHDSLIYVTWLIHVWNESLIRMMWLVVVCDMMRRMWDMLYSYLAHELFVRVAPLIHICDMTHVWHGPDTGPVAISHSEIVFRLAPKELCCTRLSALLFFLLISFFLVPGFLFFFFSNSRCHRISNGVWITVLPDISSSSSSSQIKFNEIHCKWVCVTWPGHRSSNKFARLNHHFPASAEGVLLSMDEEFLFLAFVSFLAEECWCQVCFQVCFFLCCPWTSSFSVLLFLNFFLRNSGVGLSFFNF